MALSLMVDRRKTKVVTVKIMNVVALSFFGRMISCGTWAVVSRVSPRTVSQNSQNPQPIRPKKSKTIGTSTLYTTPQNQTHALYRRLNVTSFEEKQRLQPSIHYISIPFPFFAHGKALHSRKSYIVSL